MIFPALVRYFDHKTGVEIKILWLKSLLGETSVIASYYLSDCLTEHGLVGKVFGLCADTMNSNFGGAERKDKNDVFTKLQKNLGHSLVRVGCADQILSSTTVFEQLLIICLLTSPKYICTSNATQ